MNALTASLRHRAHVGLNAPVNEGWHTSGTALRILHASLAAFFALLMVGGLVGYWNRPHPPNDFFAFDSYSRFIRHHAASSIYNQDMLRAFQAMPGKKVFAFMYPPVMLLLLWPLALVPYAVGYGLWVGSGLVACAVTIARQRGSRLLGLLAIVAPSSLWTILCGQSTLLLTALIVNGMLLSSRRPILSGVLIGLATYKPQLGILVPFALAASGRWRSFAAAGATFLSMAVITTIMFGDDVWLSWLHHLNSIVDVRTQHTSSWASLFSTVASDLVTLGVGRRLADLGQAVSCIIIVVYVWRSFIDWRAAERTEITQVRVALLCAATFLATPFAFIYDLPLFTVGLLLFVAERRRSKEAFHSVEILVIVAGLLAPCLFLINGVHCLGSLVILFVMLTAARRLRQLKAPCQDLETGHQDFVPMASTV